MHQMAFVYDLLFQSKIVSGFTKHEKKKTTLCVFIFTIIFIQYILLSFYLFIYLSLATWNRKSKQSTEIERGKNNSSVISRTRTVNKNNMLVLRLYHFHSIFENFDSSECASCHTTAHLFIVYFEYNADTYSIHLDL